jgi:hypothetical protein
MCHNLYQSAALAMLIVTVGSDAGDDRQLIPALGHMSEFDNWPEMPPLAELWMIQALNHRPEYHPLPGKTIGVLVGSPCTYQEGRFGSFVGLSSGEGSYRDIWLRCPANDPDALKRLDFSVGSSSGKEISFGPVRLASVGQIRELGGRNDYNLVEVEVNDGRGSAAYERFLASKIRFLDGSREFPLRVERVLSDLTKQAKAQRQEKVGEVEKTLAKAAREALGDKRPSEPLSENHFLYVTWLPVKEQLRAIFKRDIISGPHSHYDTYERRPNDDPRKPQKVSTPCGPFFGVEIIQEYTADKTGTAITSAPLQLKSFTGKVPAPREHPEPIKWLPAP